MKSLPVRRSQFKTALFAAWLAENGAEVGKPTNPYEVIRYRAYHDGSTKALTHIVYAKENGLLTFTGASQGHYVQFTAGCVMYPDAAAKQKVQPTPADPDAQSKGGKTRAKLLARDGDECWFCGRAMGDDCTIEHLVAKSEGGGNKLANYALAHARCNTRAANLPLVQKIALRAEMRTSPLSAATSAPTAAADSPNPAEDVAASANRGEGE